jgi:hypothetical protein
MTEQTMNLISEITAYLKSHWVHWMLILPAILTVTVVHELAHGFAVLAQGGVVTEFRWTPSTHEWGHIRFMFPAQTPYSGVMISLAPYGLWMTLCFVSILLTASTSTLPFWLSSSIFVWLFLVPLADTANTVVPYLFGAENDLLSALGQPTRPVVLMVILTGGLMATLGFFLQRRLYHARRLSLPAYSVLGCLAMTLCLSLTVWRIR